MIHRRNKKCHKEASGQRGARVARRLPATAVKCFWRGEVLGEMLCGSAGDTDLRPAGKTQARLLTSSRLFYRSSWHVKNRPECPLIYKLYKASTKDCKVLHIGFQPPFAMRQVFAWEGRQKMGLCVLLKCSSASDSNKSASSSGEKQNIPPD